MLRFFSYLGSKKTLAPAYGPPRRKVVVEPFAGSAGYSTHYQPDKVFLVDKDPVIASIWKWLLQTTPDEVMALPDFATDIDAIDADEGARNLIGFWFKHVSDRPARTASANMVESMKSGARWGWRPAVKKRIAGQLKLIRNWEFIEGDYTEAPDGDFHYFVDPPYAGLDFYKAKIDYGELAAWCGSKKCIDVCERSDADWLEFERLKMRDAEQGKRYRTNDFYDVVWSKGVDRDGLLF